MKHLFIVNPKSYMLKGRAEDTVKIIKDFFAVMPEVEYAIHITRWKRDAEGFSRRYVSASREIVRVYAVGGSGTLFEIVNGTIGLPNVQLTMYPSGLTNAFVHYYGKDKVELFRSLQSLFSSRAAAMDAIRCQNNYALAYITAGVEAKVGQRGDAFLSKNSLSTRFTYTLAGIYCGMFSAAAQHYDITIDGASRGGRYISLIVANQPCYGTNMNPAIDAKPNDGFLDVYLVKPVSRIKLAKLAFDYENGKYYMWPHHILHYRGKEISIASSRDMMIRIDGEPCVDSRIHCALVPGAVDFACPQGIDFRQPPDWTHGLRSWNYWKNLKPHERAETTA